MKRNHKPRTTIQPMNGEIVWAIFALCTFLLTNFVVGVFPNISDSFYTLIGLWLSYLFVLMAIAGLIYYYYQVYQKHLDKIKPRPRHYRPDSNYYYDT